MLSEQVCRFLDEGGVSILLGESRAEYVAREMSEERRATERPETLRAATKAARARTRHLLAFVDQEMGGICRLHDMVGPFPPSGLIGGTPEKELEAIAESIAQGAFSMGINGFLAPVVDVSIGQNQWLQGRTWSTDPDLIGRQSAAFVRGVQRANVAATIKHFPGYGTMTGDPATDSDAINPLDQHSIEAGMHAFRAPIQARADIVMVGPAIVRALDPEMPALRSAKVVSTLRTGLGFKGIVMADDLDSKATMRGDSVPRVALDALNAGCDMLLLADVEDQLERVAEEIETAAGDGRISREALAESARRIRELALRRAAGPLGQR